LHFSASNQSQVCGDSPYTRYALQFDETSPQVEFSRTDPSSGIITKSSVVIGIMPFIPEKHKGIYSTLYPVFAVEAGHNITKPSRIAKTAVDLSCYNGILRGEAGVDQAFSVAAKANRSDLFALTTLCRVRLPAFDEPPIRTLHHTTTVLLTTRAHHWLEINADYSPWAFRYLSLNAKYQYRELPPVFNFVDHKFTIGLTLKAIQSNNSHIANAAK